MLWQLIEVDHRCFVVACTGEGTSIRCTLIEETTILQEETIAFYTTRIIFAVSFGSCIIIGKPSCFQGNPVAFYIAYPLVAKQYSSFEVALIGIEILEEGMETW